MEEERTITITLAHLVVALGVIVLGGWAIWMWQSDPLPQPMAQAPAAVMIPEASPRAEAGGVTGEIRQVNRTEEGIRIRLAMDNHQFNLGEIDGATAVQLGGVPPTSYTLLEDLIGGHHVTVDMVFPAGAAGELVVEVADGVTLVFPEV